MRTTFLAAALVLTPLSAAADWTLNKQASSVTTTESNGQYSVSLTCHRGASGRLGLTISDLSQRGLAPDGGPLGEIGHLMLWIRLPDQRTDRWPVDVTPEGPALSGVAFVSSFNLGFFGNAEHMLITEAASGRRLFESSMKGTGAARIAFSERCGI